MANQLDLGLRALDANGYIAPGAKATVYLTGTSTLIDVWSDANGTIAAGNPILADGNGYWPQRFVNGTAKVVITDAADVPLQTLDPAPVSIGTGSAASEVGFEPTVAVPFTNAQAAIEGVAASVLSGVSAFGVGITGNAPLLANLDATTTAAGIYRFDGTTTGTFPTGLAAADTGLIETWRQASGAAMMEIGATTGHRVWRRRLVAGVWGAWRDVVSVGGTLADGDAIMRIGGEWVRTPRGYIWLAEQATTSGSTFDFTGIPAWATEVIVVLDRVRQTAGTIGVLARVAGAPVSTGYVACAGVIDGTSAATAGSSTNFPFFASTASGGLCVSLTLVKRPGLDTWHGVVGGFRFGGADGIATGGGRVALAGPLDGIRVAMAGGTGNQGSVVVGYK